MRSYGINLLVWSGQVGADEMALLPRIRSMGYDSVELPIFDPAQTDIAMIGAALAEHGLTCTVSTSMPAGLNLLDAETTSAGLAHLDAVIQHAAALGAPIVCGPFVVPVGELRGRGYLPQEWQQCVTALRQAGEIAAKAGVVLALEPLNRFETFFVNTTADATQLMDEVNHPAVGLLLDTFHMHIEEKSTVDAIRHAGHHIRHFHLSENDRGIVGTGQVAWQAVLAALDEVGYRGSLTVESFSAVIPELAAATCIWRPLAPSADALARESLANVQRLARASASGG